MDIEQFIGIMVYSLAGILAILFAYSIYANHLKK